MFSGKSEELIRRVKRAVIARRTVQVFKPAIDDRFSSEHVRSHDGDSFDARPVRSSAEIIPLLEPETSEEREGTVANVVFPTAIDVRAGGEADVYYGMADFRIGAARLRRIT